MKTTKPILFRKWTGAGLPEIRGSFRLLIVSLVALMANAGCFGNGPGKSAGSWKPFQESCAALPGARIGDRSALHRSFHAAFAQLMRTYPNEGETARGISNNLDSILTAIGDKSFAEALLRERPLVRAAVRDCLVESDIRGRFPLTFQIFQEAPQNEWASDFAEEKTSGAESNSASQ